MRNIIAGQHAIDGEEFAELAIGVDETLFTGRLGESSAERAVRLDVALAVLEDLRREDFELAAYAERLLSTAPVPVPVVRRRRRSVAEFGAAA
ncbi:hypothetical protein ACIRBX_06605 [Kitasatospora sp. NPDC096147]|uniref:hypothetical protein n=1 Tax=Kitasatospora sp. NPDC096147 TaxID=3364093 RepID=UPI00380506C2